MRLFAPSLLVAVALAACSSDPGHPPAGGTPPANDADAGADGTDAASSTHDGTVGQACATDADCRGPHGPGVNRCSNTAFVDGPLLPTPVCVVPSCDPGTDGNVHRCDGPDTPSSPGICFDTGGGAGVCLPACRFAADGSAPRGCAGKDTCNFYGEGADPGGVPYGVGYCFAGCTADADCPSGSACQSDTGLCVKRTSPPGLAIGSGCNPSAQDPGCNCFGVAAAGGGVGYCTQFCITGSLAARCPSGMVCDPGEPAAAEGDGGSSGGLVGFASVTPGLVGSCLFKCSLPPDAGDAAGADSGRADSGGSHGAGAFDGDANATGLDDATRGGGWDDAGGHDPGADDAGGDDAGADAAGGDDAGADAASGDDVGQIDAAAATEDGGPSDAATEGEAAARLLQPDGGDAGAPYPSCPAAAVCSAFNVGGPDCVPMAR